MFKQSSVLYSMLLLRQVGMKYKQIAVLYDCDHSTIYHHCVAYKVKPTVKFMVSPYILSILAKVPEEIIIEKLTNPVIPIQELETQWYTDSNGDRYNKGFDYKDYLRKHVSKL